MRPRPNRHARAAPRGLTRASVAWHCTAVPHFAASPVAFLCARSLRRTLSTLLPCGAGRCVADCASRQRDRSTAGINPQQNQSQQSRVARRLARPLRRIPKSENRFSRALLPVRDEQGDSEATLELLWFLFTLIYVYDHGHQCLARLIQITISRPRSSTSKLVYDESMGQGVKEARRHAPLRTHQ